MPYSGTLMTRVFTSRSQLPVEDAAVSILQHEPGGRQRLINIQTAAATPSPPSLRHQTPKTANPPGRKLRFPSAISGSSAPATSFCSFKTFKFSLESPVFKICP